MLQLVNKFNSAGSGEKPDRYMPVVSEALKQCEDKSDKDFCCLLLQNPTNQLQNETEINNIF